MPLYEYVCRQCHSDFESLVPAGRRDAADTPCPRCGATRTARKISLTAPAVVKSGGSAVPNLTAAPRWLLRRRLHDRLNARNLTSL